MCLRPWYSYLRHLDRSACPAPSLHFGRPYLCVNFSLLRFKMRKRNVNTGPSSFAQTTAKDQRKTENKPCWRKRGLFALFVFLLLMPFTLIVARELFQHLVYTHRMRVPFFVDLGQPSDFSLNHTINMYLTSEEGISLGVWHTVPASQWRQAQGKGMAWYQSTISDGSPVIIYLHGNTGTRGASHRVGVAKVLSALGYHVTQPDYRGFGDSSGEPTEVGLTTDALHVYKWVKKHSGSSPVVLWGHSLGTGTSGSCPYEGGTVTVRARVSAHSSVRCTERSSTSPRLAAANSCNRSPAINIPGTDEGELNKDQWTQGSWPELNLLSFCLCPRVDELCVSSVIAFSACRTASSILDPRLDTDLLRLTIRPDHLPAPRTAFMPYSSSQINTSGKHSAINSYT
ncbi:lysophosphatidylserine lipase ABHD12 isoform X2 [Nerophis lumbriciformis]|uniref:lysophosphatidylserine lipase ABHD12 isoform X2 n=1 Tax=Nerophis lumbriciformis TaxID=546530 RepID=UPI002ADF08A4|nr:lysophosphatidylserine lipase ABHD12-like isoform X2 [Nerophis lumbriciformis]